MTREQRAFARLFGSHPKPPTVSQSPPKTSRVVEISGGYLKAPVLTFWEQKYGVWFMMHADRALRGWMGTTTGVLCEPSLERFCRLDHLSFRIL